MRALDKFQRWKLIGADSLIKQYFAIKQDRLIEQREEEIRYPWKPQDENVGGGKCSSRGDSKQEITFTKLESDPLLKQYREIVEVVEGCLNKLDGQDKMIIVSLYDCKGNSSCGRYSDKEVAEVLHMPAKVVASVRKSFIREVADVGTIV